MSIRSRTFGVLAAAAVVASFAFGTPAYADVIHVGAGQSIQAAIDAASPGDTIIVSRGVFQEDLTITKDHITLIGAGAHGDMSTILEPPTTPTGLCNSQDDISGICILGDFQHGTPITGVTVKGFLIRNFSDMGILGILSNDHVIESNVVENNAAYGIACFTCSGGQYYDNTAFGSGEAGFYQGDSPDANSIMEGNESWLNGFGYFFRDAQHGVFAHNIARGNCAGLMFLDTGGPVQVGNWDAFDNNVFHNDHYCPPSEEGPALSGVGIFIIGGDSIHVHDNTVWRNAPSGEVIKSGGIVLTSGAVFGGADPTNNTIDGNVAYVNKGVDINYDGKGFNNTFVDNQCGKSIPRGLC